MFCLAAPSFLISDTAFSGIQKNQKYQSLNTEKFKFWVKIPQKDYNTHTHTNQTAVIHANRDFVSEIR